MLSSVLEFMDELREFARYFRPYKVSLIIGILAMLAGILFNLWIPLMPGFQVPDHDLLAIYTYLSAIRCINTIVDGQPQLRNACH